MPNATVSAAGEAMPATGRLTRRAAFALAAGAAALTVAGAAAAAPSPAPTEAERLLAQLTALHAEIETALDAESELWERFESTKPEPPACLLVTDGVFNPLFNRRLVGVDEPSVYSSLHIDELRSSPRVRHEFLTTGGWWMPTMSGDPSPFAPPDVLFRVAVHEAAQRRAEAVIAAFDEWTAECRRQRRELGLDKFGDEIAAMNDRWSDLFEKLLAIEVTTLRDLAAQASAVRLINAYENFGPTIFDGVQRLAVSAA